MRESRNRHHGRPDAAIPASAQQRRDNRIDRVAVAIDRVPDGDESPCFREEQEQNAVQHRQRLFENHLGGSAAAARRAEGTEQQLERLDHPAAERAAHANAMPR